MSNMNEHLNMRIDLETRENIKYILEHSPERSPKLSEMVRGLIKRECERLKSCQPIDHTILTKDKFVVVVWCNVTKASFLKSFKTKKSALNYIDTIINSIKHPTIQLIDVTDGILI